MPGVNQEREWWGPLELAAWDDQREARALASRTVDCSLVRDRHGRLVGVTLRWRHAIGSAMADCGYGSRPRATSAKCVAALRSGTFFEQDGWRFSRKAALAPRVLAALAPQQEALERKRERPLI